MTTWATPPFSIGGVVVDLPQSLGLTMEQPMQSGGYSDMRMGSGALRRQTRWKRIKASLSFDGYVPVGLMGLDWTAPMTVQWPMPRSVYSATPSVILPAARRSDCPPVANAWVGGIPHPTPVTMNTNTATAVAVSNATGYTFAWWPEFSALVTLSESGDRTQGTFQHHVEIEEV